MAITDARKAELARMSIPSDKETRERILSFKARAGMTDLEFAEAIGYARTSVNSFLRGHYAAHAPHNDANTAPLRAAAKEYMDLHDVQFTMQLHGTHHRTASFEEVRRAALNALKKGTAYVVDGPPGTEKTWSLRQIEREVNEQKLGRFIYVYARVAHSPHSFLQEVCSAAGISNRGSQDQLLRKLRFFLGKGRTLLAVDEAQHLSHHGLEVLRQLLDLPPHFGVMLAGSHDLSQRLSHWTMEQWRSRLRKKIYLNGPTQAECRDILRAELGNISDQLCDATIARCVSTAARVEVERGKNVERQFDYYSARLLFGAIESAQESIAAQPKAKQVAA